MRSFLLAEARFFVVKVYRTIFIVRKYDYIPFGEEWIAVQNQQLYNE
jgi:hypothetical protein